MLYQFLIGPLQLLFEYIYGLANHFLGSLGLSVLALSLCMNLLLLPLYRRADALQEEERSAEKRMEKDVAHIRKHFSGDERFLILRAYYRQHHYKPWYVLKGFLSLALEIPFFIAAYNFLSGYPPLSGAAFGPIADLGAPDGLLRVFGHAVNLLPLLMTFFNLLSALLYTKGFPLKEKLTLFGMAAVFLVLLYDSPAALVLYWTLNNLFSLVRSALSRLPLPRRDKKQAPSPVPAGRREGKAFLLGGILLALLTGVLIPSAVIVSSTGEFISVTGYYSPLLHILNAALLSFGAFVLWAGVFFRLSGEKGRKAFTLAFWVLCLLALADYLFFGTNLGLLSPDLRYEEAPYFSPGDRLLNLGVLLAAAAAAVLLFWKKRKAVFPALLALVLAVSGMSAVNLVKIHAAAAETEAIVRAAPREKASFPLSRGGKNVVFIMLDRAIDSYFPYILEEKPQLKEQFAGFTWYPDTLSFGPQTLYSAGALYGGYEYRVSEMNKRPEKLLAEKHDEALKLLPRLFGEAGYEITLCDPSVAGFKSPPDITVFDEYPYMHAYLTQFGQFYPQVQETLDRIWKRNFFCYGLVKCCPLLLQPTLYHEGDYYSSIRECREFERAHAVLEALPEMTKVSPGAENTFLSLCNHTTHDPVILSGPDYDYNPAGESPVLPAVKTAEGLPPLVLETERQLSHYHVNMAALLRLGEWLDFLREEGVYDNTRILIGADHGFALWQYEDAVFDPSATVGDAMFFNPLFLFKDFGEKGLKRDDAFMTNADAPSMLLQGLVENPVNPFTGNPVTNEAKEKEEMVVTTSYNWKPEKNNSPTLPPVPWYSVKDRVLDASCWSKLGEW